MKIIKFLAVLFFIFLIGGFGYFTFTDITIEQQKVSKEIPHERLFDTP